MKSLLSSAAAVTALVAIAGCGGGGAAATGPSATVTARQVTGAGTVLVDAKGLPLYAPAQEKGGRIMCTGSCTSIWRPLTISGGKPSGPGGLGVVRRPDGTRQVTAGGRPLYRFAEDSAGKATGNGVMDAFGGHRFTWHVITAEGAPAKAGGAAKSGGSSSGGGSYGGY